MLDPNGATPKVPDPNGALGGVNKDERTSSRAERAKMSDRKKEMIKKCIAFVVLIGIVSAVGMIVIKYQVDGENNMPFELSKITIISTAEPEIVSNNDEDTTWNFEINQVNDIYIFIDKNEEYNKYRIIDSVKIENIKITKAPDKGTVKTYMPSSAGGSVFSYDDAFLVNDSLTYGGATVSNEKNLEIGNQGGKMLIRFANTNLATYKSNEAEEIKHDGTILNKTEVQSEDLKFEVEFDIIIDVETTKYKATVALKLPAGDIIEEGKSSQELTDFSNVVFKRIR